MHRPKKKNATPQQTPTEVRIEKLSHDGRGIAHINGKTIFVENALANELVEIQIVSRHGRFDEAKTIEVIQDSPERVEPPCAHAEICGGCSLQFMHSDAQVALKESVLREQLEHFGGLKPAHWLAPLRSETEGYRHKARLGAKYVFKKNTLLIGFREKRSNFLADIYHCEVLHPKVGKKIPVLRECVSELSVRDAIPQIEVAVGEDGVALVFRHLKPLTDKDIAALIKFGQEYHFHIYLQPGGNDSVHKIWPEDGAERLHYSLPDFDLKMAFHPLDFTQVNPGINQKMVKQALELLDPQPNERVLDLFCGLGNFTLPLARKAKEVIGVEGSAAMVLRGQENASANGVTNTHFYATDLTQDFSSQPWGQLEFDKILIDPPRTGALEIVQKLAKFGAKRLVYVSCNPATLARDAGELQQLGYRLTHAGVMDMFPHTTHVESIAVFERIKA